MLHLPTYQDLSAEQVEVHNIPPEGIHLVVGPPGSGKTVVALRRTHNLSNQAKEPVVLIYNHTLEDYLGGAMQELGIAGNVDTQLRWFGKWYKAAFSEWVPNTAPYVPDWDRVLDRLEETEFTQVDHVLIDEGQDFNPLFFRVMRKVARNLMVFADENQRLTEQNSTLDEIRKNLRLQLNQVHRLTRNYRNSRPIAEFAAQFYAGMRTGIPDLPDRAGDKPSVLLKRDTNSMVGIMERAAINNREASIGVFLPSNALVKTYFNRLDARLPGQVQMYDWRTKNEMDFAGKRITILAYPSAKGLEFDRVYLPELQTQRTDANPDSTKMKFYVLCSRAREHLVLATAEETIPHLMAHVPANLYEQR